MVEAVPILYWRREDVTEMPANMVELPIAVVVHVEQDMVEGVVGKVSALFAKLTPPPPPPQICLFFETMKIKIKKVFGNVYSGVKTCSLCMKVTPN